MFVISVKSIVNYKWIESDSLSYEVQRQHPVWEWNLRSTTFICKFLGICGGIGLYCDSDNAGTVLLRGRCLGPIQSLITLKKKREYLLDWIKIHVYDFIRSPEPLWWPIVISLCPWCVRRRPWTISSISLKPNAW